MEIVRWVGEGEERRGGNEDHDHELRARTTMEEGTSRSLEGIVSAGGRVESAREARGRGSRRHERRRRKASVPFPFDDETKRATVGRERTMEGEENRVEERHRRMKGGRVKRLLVVEADGGEGRETRREGRGGRRRTSSGLGRGESW